MSTIVAVHAHKIMDRHGGPMVETVVELASGAIGRAAVPVVPCGFGQDQQRTRSGDKAITNIETIIAPFIIGSDALDQITIDRTMLELDATDDKTNLGFDAILSVSLAVARAAAEFLYLPLYRYIGGVNAKQMPVPMMSILNSYGRAADNHGFFSFMVMPVGAGSWNEALRMCAEVSHYFLSIMKNRFCFSSMSGESGLLTEQSTDKEVLSCIVQAIERAGYRPGEDVALAIDVAADRFYDEETSLYHMTSEVTSQKLIDYYDELAQLYPIVSIERGLAESDGDGWQQLTARLGEKIQVIEVFSNAQRLRQSICSKSANAVLFRLDEIGSLTETLDCIEMAKRAGRAVILSYLENETANTAIADIAVGANTGQIKISAPSNMYGRTGYGQLLVIEEDLASAACYKGREILHNN